MTIDVTAIRQKMLLKDFEELKPGEPAAVIIRDVVDALRLRSTAAKAKARTGRTFKVSHRAGEPVATVTVEEPGERKEGEA